jgi:L-fuconolactonase
MPGDLKRILHRNCFEGCVAVQATQSEEETNFLIQLAHEHDFIKGVVGWVDLRADNISERLAYYKQFNIVKGFRHILQSENPRDMMLHPQFKKGIAALNQFGFTYDLLILPDQLKNSIKLVTEFPDQKFIIDHLAHPNIKSQEMDLWEKDIRQIAQCENVYCKISAMVTNADWHHWEKEIFKPYIDVALHAFGGNRILFGSDWPVCLLASDYDQTLDIVLDYFSLFTDEEQEKFFGKNAVRFYNL